MLWYQTRSLSAERFISWRKWRVGISHCGEQQFLLFLVTVALLLGLVSTWHYKAVFGKLCDTNSGIHVLTDFLCFLQMDRSLLLPSSSLIVVKQKSVTLSYSSNCSFSICSRYYSPLQNVGFPAAVIRSSSMASITLQVVLLHIFLALAGFPGVLYFETWSLAVPLEN